MKDKSLKNKAIDIKGKSYVTVADRVLFFNEEYPAGFITTELLPLSNHEQIYIKATITPDLAQPTKVFTGHAQEVVGDGMVNKTSALENAETSAVGRALALMGIGVIESIASVDEIHKATNRGAEIGKKASDKQTKFIYELLQNLNISVEEYEEQIGLKLADLTSAQASKCIGVLKGRIDKVLDQEATQADDKAKDFLADAGDPHLGTIN